MHCAFSLGTRELYGVSFHVFDENGRPGCSGSSQYGAPNAYRDMSNTTPFRLPKTGRYTLVVEPPNGRYGENSYSFVLHKRQIATRAIAFGERVREKIQMSSDLLEFTFTKASAGEIYFDSLLNDSGIQWAIVDADNRWISGNRFDSDKGDLSRRFLAAGDYRLIVSRTSGTPGDVAFRLLDFSELTEIAPGVPVQVTLDPGNQTRGYRFTNEKGKIFKIDLPLGNNTSASWRLIDPNGREIFASADVTDRAPVTLPFDGEYVLLFEGDINQSNPNEIRANLLEVLERQAIPLSSVVRNAADFTISNVAVAAAGEITAGSPITISWRVNNEGELGAVPGRDRVIIRRADTGEIIGLRVTDAGTTSLGPSGFINRQVTLPLPSGALGTGDLIIEIETDIQNSVDETSGGLARELNNTAAMAFTAASDQLPDLFVTDISTEPASGYEAGDTVTVRWRTTNNGTATMTGSFTEQVRIRNTSLHNAPTILINSLTYDHATLGDLAPGEGVNRQLTFTWPEGTNGIGVISFEVVTDLEDDLLEGNETNDAEGNNRTDLDVLSAPDIVVENLSMNVANPQSGDTITLSWSVRNAGNAAAPVEWDDRVYVYNGTARTYVTDQNIDFDQEAGTILAAGASRQRSLTFTLPDGVNGAGALYAVVQLDVNFYQSLLERNVDGTAESNNSMRLDFTSTLRQYANLTVGSPSMEGTPRAGGTVALSWRIVNQGPVDAGARTDRVVLSADDIIGNDDDIVIGSSARTTLAAGSFEDVSISLQLPQDLVGAYKLAVITDALSAVEEGDDEGDNVSVPLSVEILPANSPDLVVEAVAGPSDASWGDTATVSWRVGNDGQAIATGDWTDRVYLSSDSILDASDILLGEFAASRELQPGQTYVAEHQIVVPGGLTGSFRILVETDAENAVAEGAKENNNVEATLEPVLISSSPAPDLVVTDVSGPIDAVPGERVTVNWRVENQGEGAARGPFYDRVYLTRTGTLSGARYMGQLVHSTTVEANDGYPASMEIVVPLLEEGEWTLLVQTDALGQVYELGREDNLRLADEPFGIATPNLEVTNISAPDSADSGDVITISWTVSNTGTGPTASSRIDRILLSRDETADSGDTVLGEVTRGLIGAGEDDTASLDVILPIDSHENYHIILITDVTDLVEERANEGDNAAARALSVNLSPFSDLQVSNVTAPPLTVADPATITVGWTVSNVSVGVGRESGWDDQIWYSLDDIIGDGDDRLLMNVHQDSPLAAGSSYTKSAEILLPASFSERMRIYVVADSGNAVFENGKKANNRAEAANDVDVARKPYADLNLIGIEVAADAQSGQALNVAWTVRNDGIGLTDRTEWSDQIILSRNPDGSGHIASEYFTHLGALPVGELYRRTASIRVPDGVTGTVYVSVRTGGPYEFVYTANNQSPFQEVQVALSPSADLKVNEIATLENATEGETIDIAWRVVNQGAAAVEGTWIDRVILQPLDSAKPAIVIGNFTNERRLEIGQAYQRTERFQLPDKIEGAYQLVVVTNYGGGVYEHGAAAQNNQETDDRPLEVAYKDRPNLQVASIVTAPSVSAGGTVQATFEIINQGAIAATGEWTDSVWLSLDDKLSSDDILISRTGNPQALMSGETYDMTSGIGTIPLRWSGDAYILVSTDSGSNVDEYPFDNDNVLAQKFHVDPLPRSDLVTSDVVAPAQAVYGSEIEVRYKVANKGAGDTLSSSWRDTIWITRDQRRPNTSEFADVAGADFLKGNSARLLATVTHVGTLAVGGSYEMVVRVTIPADLPSGTYYITPWSDSFDVEPEDTLAVNINPDDPSELDNNNYKARKIEVLGFTPVRPDLLVETVSTPGPVEAGSDALSVTWMVRNGGLLATEAESWIDRIYLSDKETLGASGETLWLLGEVRHEGNLGAGDAYTQTQSFSLPPSAKGMYVHVITDASVRGRQAVVEENENNNVATGAADVSNDPADLRVTSVAASPGSRSGEKATITWTVENFGGDVWQGTEYWRDSVWLSRDPVFDRNRATHLTSVVRNADTQLLSGLSYTQSAEVTLPPGTDGAYYVHVFTDVAYYGAMPNGEILNGNIAVARDHYRSSVFEDGNDPTGNRGRGVIDILFAEPDLKITGYSIPANATSGGEIEIAYEVTNQGGRATRSVDWYDRIFISVDDSLDRQDHMIGEVRHVGILGAGEKYAETVRLRLPIGISGDITLFIETDATSDEGYSYQPSTLLPGLKGLRASNDQVKEFAGEGNNRVDGLLNVSAKTGANLEILDLSHPQQAVQGTAVTGDLQDGQFRRTGKHRKGWRET